MSVICAQLRTRTHRGRPHVIRASPATPSRLGLCGDKRQHGPQRGFPHRVQQRRCLRLQPGVAAWLRVGRVYCTQYSYTMKKCAQHHDRGGADRLDNLLHAICGRSHACVFGEGDQGHGQPARSGRWAARVPPPPDAAFLTGFRFSFSTLGVGACNLGRLGRGCTGSPAWAYGAPALAAPRCAEECRRSRRLRDARILNRGRDRADPCWWYRADCEARRLRGTLGPLRRRERRAG